MIRILIITWCLFSRLYALKCNMGMKKLVEEWYSRTIVGYQKGLRKVWTKIVRKPHWILTLFIWGCWGCLTPCWSVLDLRKINLEKSIYWSISNLFFSACVACKILKLRIAVRWNWFIQLYFSKFKYTSTGG